MASPVFDPEALRLLHLGRVQERALSMKRNPEQLLVLGAGLAGLSAAYHARVGSTVVLEQHVRPGGHAVTHRQAGHIFDITGHWLHLREPETLTWIRALDPTVDWSPIVRRAEIYLGGVHMPYPFQSNLHALSPEQRQDCLRTLPSAVPEPSMAQDFEAYVLERFGQGMTDAFFRPYNEKLWGCALSELRPDCMRRFLPQPSPDEIRAGAKGPPVRPLGYNSCFYYPAAGGIDHLSRALARQVEASENRSLLCQRRVERIDLQAKIVFTKGPSGPESWRFDHLISTLALPALVALMPEAPEAIQAFARQLKWSSWRYLDLALRQPGPRDCHWMYVPDPDIAFFRVGCSSHACPAMAPPGQASLCVELAEREAPLDMEGILQDLIRVGMLGDKEDVKFVHERRIEYAYVHFDQYYPQARARILDWLSEQGIQSVGRYGAWDYGSMEDSLEAGRCAALALGSQGASL